MEVLFPLMEVEQKMNVIDTLVDLCIRWAGDRDRQQPIVKLLLTVLLKSKHETDDGSCGSEDVNTAMEFGGVSHLEEGAQTPLCISSFSLEKVIKAATSEDTKLSTNYRLEAILEAVFSALLSPSLNASGCSGGAAESAVRNAARRILQVLEHSDKVSPTILPPLLNQQSLSSLAFGHRHPAHVILGSVSEHALQTYFQQCLKCPSASRVKTAGLLFRHLPVLQNWLISDKGVALLSDALSAAAEDRVLGHLLPVVKEYLEVVSDRSAANSANIFASLEEMVWGTCCELFLQTGAEEEEQVSGEVILLLVKGTQKKRLTRTQRKLMKTLLAARDGGETVWSR